MSNEASGELTNLRRKLMVATKHTEELSAVADRLQERVVRSERMRAHEHNARNIRLAMHAMRIPAALEVWERHAAAIESGVADAEQVCADLNAMPLGSFEERFRYQELGPRLCETLKKMLVPDTDLLLAPE